MVFFTEYFNHNLKTFIIFLLIILIFYRISSINVIFLEKMIKTDELASRIMKSIHKN